MYEDINPLAKIKKPNNTLTVCTYPCISFRRQRVSHPGAEPGSGRLDGDGVADARQFAACWKERSEIGEHLEQRPAGYSG